MGRLRKRLTNLSPSDSIKSLHPYFDFGRSAKSYIHSQNSKVSRPLATEMASKGAIPPAQQLRYLGGAPANELNGAPIYELDATSSACMGVSQSTQPGIDDPSNSVCSSMSTGSSRMGVRPCKTYRIPQALRIPAIHTQLDSTRAQIRLVRFVPCSGSHEIQCQMTTFELDAAPKYKALSYAWGCGCDECIENIRINGREFEIRRNLYDFLQAWGQKLGCWLWVDQLCIDQLSLRERNHQVSFMERIYRCAEETLAWLGPDPDNGVALGLLRNITDHLHAMGKKFTLLESGHYALHNQKFPRLITHEAAEALFHLDEQPYWTRHWIAQEIMLSRRCTIVYGVDSLAWTDFKTAVQLSELFGSEANYGGLRLWRMSRLIACDQGIKAADAVTAWRLAIWFSFYSECMDPRDKIFGMQQIFPTRLHTDVDYSRSMRDIFADASARYLIWLESLSTDDRRDIPVGVALAELARSMGLRFDQSAEVCTTILTALRAGRDDSVEDILARVKEIIIPVLDNALVSSKPSFLILSKDGLKCW